MRKRILSPEQYARKLELNREYIKRVRQDPDRLEAYKDRSRRNHRDRYKTNKEHIKAKQKEYRANRTERQKQLARDCNRRHKEKVAACPVLREQYATYKREWDRERLKRRAGSVSEPLLGSVLAASAPSYWRDILAELNDAVPRFADRDDIIAQAALLIIEGMDLGDAIPEAKRLINRQNDHRFKTVPIESVFSLC